MTLRADIWKNECSLADIKQFRELIIHVIRDLVRLVAGL
jgi:hypothetical protein